MSTPGRGRESFQRIATQAYQHLSANSCNKTTRTIYACSRWLPLAPGLQHLVPFNYSAHGCSGKEADANTLRECVATAGGSIGPLTELGDLQLLHGDRLLDVTVADAAAAATTTDSKHVLYASLTDLNDSGSFPDLLLSVLQPSLGAQGPYQQLYQRLHQHQGRPPAQPSRRPPPPPPQPQLLVWAPVHGSASGQQPHLVSDDEGLVVQQLGEQEWRACKARLEAGGAVLGLAALRLLVGLHYSGAVYSDATMAALRGELARLGAALRRGPPAAAAGGGATQAKQVRKELPYSRAEQCGFGFHEVARGKHLGTCALLV